MEEPKNTTVKQGKNKTVINISKAGGGGGGGRGGGGLGACILFLSGAAATAAFLFTRRLRKSSNTKNCNHDKSVPSTEIPYKFKEDYNANEDNGLPSIAPKSKSCPHMDMDQNSRNGTSNTGMHENDTTMMISDESFFRDEKDRLEVNGSNMGHVSEVEDVIHSNSPKVLDRIMRFHTSSMKEEEFPLQPIIENKTLLHPITAENKLHTQEIEIITEENANDTALVDQDIEDHSQDMLVNTEGEKVDANTWEQEEMGELHCQEAAETIKADQSMLVIMKSSEEQTSSIHGGQESKSIRDLHPKTSEFVGEASFQPVPGNSYLYNYEKLGNDCEESALTTKIAVVEKGEELEAAYEEEDKGDTKTQIIEVDASPCPEHFGGNETNEKLDATHDDRGNGSATNLVFAEIEDKCNEHDCSLTIRIKENETPEAAYEFQGQVNTVILNEEGEQKCQVGLLTSEAVELTEEIKVHEEADQGKEETEILLVGEEKGAQHDAKITGEQSQATMETAQLPDDNASGSSHQMLQMDEFATSPNGDQEDDSASDDLTSEDSPCEYCSAVQNTSLPVLNTPANLKTDSRIDNGFKEVEASAEAREVKKENAASGPRSEGRVIEREDLPMQLIEIQEYLDDDNGKALEGVEDTIQLRHEGNVNAEELKEEDQDQDRDEDDGDDEDAETSMTEKMEEKSEGTGDSSADSNAEQVWPAELIQDLATELKELEVEDSKENLQVPEEEQSVEKQVHTYLKSVANNDGIKESRLQKGNDKVNIKLSLFERYMQRLAELTDQTTNSQKKRILILTMLVVSGSWCLWYFGLPFLKICLIIILIKIISKLHGI